MRDVLDLHMCCRKEWLFPLNKLMGYMLPCLMGTRQSLRVLVRLRSRLHDRRAPKLREIHYVWTVDRNLISLGRLDGFGASYIFMLREVA